MRLILVSIIFLTFPAFIFSQSKIGKDTLLTEEYYHLFDSTLTELENKQETINIAILNSLENAYGKIILSSNDMSISNVNDSNNVTSSSSFRSRTKSLVQGKVSKVLELIFEKRYIEKNKIIYGERIKTKVLFNYVKIKFLAKETEQPFVFEQELDLITRQIGLLNAKVDKNTEVINELRIETESAIIDPIIIAGNFYNLKDFNQAIKYYKIGLNRIKNQNYGEKYVYYYFIGDSYVNAKKYIDAISYSDSLLFLNPVEPRAIILKTSSLFLTGKTTEASDLINNYLYLKGRDDIFKTDTIFNTLEKFSESNPEVILKGLQIFTDEYFINFDKRIKLMNISKDRLNRPFHYILVTDNKFDQRLSEGEITNYIANYLINSNINLLSAAKFIADIKFNKSATDIFQTIVQKRSTKGLMSLSPSTYSNSLPFQNNPTNRLVYAKTGKQYSGPIHQYDFANEWTRSHYLKLRDKIGEGPHLRGIYTNERIVTEIDESIECPCDALIPIEVYDAIKNNSGSILINNYSEVQKYFNSGWLYLIAGDFKLSIDLFSSVVKYFMKLGREIRNSENLLQDEKEYHNMAIINLAHSYFLDGNYEIASYNYKNIYVKDLENKSIREVIRSDWAEFISRGLTTKNKLNEFTLKYLDNLFENN